MKRWYCVHTHSREEAKTALHLNRQGFVAYLPQYLKPWRHARRETMVKTPLFPRYLFVSLDLLRDRWLAVRSTIGVAGIIGTSEQPTAISQRTISEIKLREDENGLIRLNQGIIFRRGEKVEVTDGPFRDQPGIFDCLTDEDRVQILLDFLGRPIEIQVPLETIRAIA